MTSGAAGDDSIVCVRCILSVNDMTKWFKSQGYKDITAFIKQLNEFAKGVHNGLNNADTIKEPCLIRVKDFLDQLMILTDEVKPLQGDKGQRFGNKAFRTWYDEMKKKLSTMLETHYSVEDRNELRPYLEESFGNKHRIDYGTGHELSFIIFLMGLYKLEMIKDDTVAVDQQPPQPSKERMKTLSQEILTLFAVKYMPLCRKIQIIYQLEPAGSHGVYSLDDFQFLPFLFGSSQLIAHPLLEPKNFPDQKIAEDNANRYMFFAAIHFIHQVKKGPFPEHSNQLWNISGVENWSKINRGLLKMYTDEVLNKFPIVQHLVFGPRILVWKPAS